MQHAGPRTMCSRGTGGSSRAGYRAVVRTLAAVTLSAVLLQPAPCLAATRKHRPTRSLRLGDVTCGCGRNLTHELVVKRVKPSYCTDVPYRGPRGFKAEDKGYPLKLKVRRSRDRSRLLIAWNLKYIPRHKRARITDFNLHFMKKGKRREQRSACFVVRRSATKQCRRKVSCVAKYPKRRARRVTVNLLYKFANKPAARGGRKRRHQDRKYFRLKASVARKKRSTKTSSGASANMAGQNIKACKDWHPSINATCAGQGTLQVKFDPANPLADEIEVALHRGISPKHEMSKLLPRGDTSCTFENLQSDEYSVTLRPRSTDCYGFIPYRSALVTVNGKPLRPICSDWAPSVHIREVTADPHRLEVSYDVPSNLQTDEIEVALEEDLRQVVAIKVVNRRETNTTFNVSPNRNKTYQAMVRPLGCTDCRDYKMYRERCELSYHTSNALRINGFPRSVAVSYASFTVQDPPFNSTVTEARNISTTEGTNSTAATILPSNNSTATPRTGVERSSVSPMEAALGPHHLQVLLSFLIGSVLIVAVAVLVGRWICKRRPRRTHSGDISERSRRSSCVDENTEQKRLLGSPTPEATADYVDETQPHTLNPASTFASAYDSTNRTELKQSPLLTDSPRVLFLVHAWEEDRDILGHLADVMQCLCRGRVSVKVDFRCREENAMSVTEWAERLLMTCTHVVVVLSDSLLRLCRSYRGSMMLALSSPLAFHDVAPLVMTRLSEGMCAGRAVFLHFGMRDAQRQFHSLLNLYSSPRGSPLGSECCEVFDNGQAVSSPPNLPSYHSLQSTEDSHPPCCPRVDRHRYQSTPPEARVDSSGHCRQGRERHKSAPNGRRCPHLPPAYPPEQVCFRLPVSSASSDVFSFHTARSPLSPSVSEYVDAQEDPPPPYSECVVPALPPNCPRGQHSIAEPLGRSQKTHMGFAGNTPQLISLTNETGLQELLRFIWQDEGAIDSAMASEYAESLFLCLERRHGDLNSVWEPGEHSAAGCMKAN